MLGAWGGRSVMFEGFSYPYPHGAMNIATQSFMDSGADRMVVIDTDLQFERHHLDCLLSHDEPLVFGLYPKKEIGCNWPVIPLDDSPDPFSAEGPLCEVQTAPRGFMCVHRSAFEMIRGSGRIESYPCAQTGRLSWEYWQTLRGGHSEDFYFCNLWRSLGGRVLIDRRIVCNHLGSASYPIKGTY